MEIEMYLDDIGKLLIIQKSKNGKDLFFELKIKFSYNTDSSDLNGINENEYFLELKKSIAKKYNIETYEQI